MTSPGRSARSRAAGPQVTAPARRLRDAVVALLAVLVVALGSGLVTPAPAARAAESPSPGATSPGPASPDPTTPTPEPSVTGEVTEPTEPTDPAESEPTPLTVRVDALSPAVVPRRGPVVMRGTVTNTSDETWADVNVLPFVGDAPITTREALDEASRTTEETAVGDRVDDVGAFASVGDLAPGDRAAFRVRLSQEQLPPRTVAGVYWIGVHALGSNTDGRDLVADGRARTFITVADRDALAGSRVPVSLVLPLRADTTRGADGSLADPEAWVARSAPDSRLDRIARFAAGAGSAAPLTWLVDPAVLDALDDLGRGNPALSLGPPERLPEEPPAGEGEGDQEGEGSGDGDQEEEQQPTAELDEAGLPDPDEAADARGLLERIESRLAEDTVLALPYADADAVALLHRRPTLLARALRLSESTLRERGLDGEPVVSPPDGRIDPEVVDRLPDRAGMLLSDTGDLTGETAGTLRDRSVTFSDARAGSGGPAPTPALAPLALRQRILAESLLESTRAAGSGEAPRPVVVTLPPAWDPGPTWSQADFFDGLDVPWLRLAGLPASSEPLDEALEGQLDYPEESREQELGRDNVGAAVRLVRQGAVLAQLLDNDNDVLARVTGAALGAVSYHVRDRPGTGVQAAEALRGTVTADLQRVGVFGTDFVTLSSGSGTLTVSLVNDLQQPVTVGLSVVSDGGVRLEDVEPVELGPEQRVTLPLPVTSDEGVHAVSIVPVTTSGAAAGAPYDFVLRTSQVGRTIWFVMAAATALFLVQLLRRVRQRWRERRTRRPVVGEEAR